MLSVLCVGNMYTCSTSVQMECALWISEVQSCRQKESHPTFHPNHSGVRQLLSSRNAAGSGWIAQPDRWFGDGRQRRFDVSCLSS